MNSVIKIILMSLLLCMPLVASAQEVVLAFTDTLAPSASLDTVARAKMLVHNMARADVPQAMFLIRTKDIAPHTLDSVINYDETGQLLVNAGHNYSLYKRQKSYGYPIDILAANGQLAPYFHYQQHVFYPYLLEGGNEEMLAQLQHFLADHNYRPTYITTPVRDDYLDTLFQAQARQGRTVNMRALETAYAKLVADKVQAYDARARLFLGFSPRQVVLLHETDVTAYCIIDIIDELNARGYRIIPPARVFTDPVANPFFYQGFSAYGYMAYLTGITDERWQNSYRVTAKERQTIEHYLLAEGLSSLVSPAE